MLPRAHTIHGLLEVRSPIAGLCLANSVGKPEDVMPRGSKAKYTSKQKRRAEHIEDSYESRGVKSGEAARRAWATVNKEEGGGKKSGSGRGRKPNRSASSKGGRKGGKASGRSRRASGSGSTASRRSAAARKAGKASGRARKRRASSRRRST
jgi:hypothetical protein